MKLPQLSLRDLFVATLLAAIFTLEAREFYEHCRPKSVRILPGFYICLAVGMLFGGYTSHRCGGRWWVGAATAAAFLFGWLIAAAGYEREISELFWMP